MKRYLVSIVVIIILLLVSITGCGKGIPTAEQARYEVVSEQAPGRGMLVYTRSYSVENGVLYLKDGYYAYSSGWTFSPTYKYYESEIAFTKFSVRARDE